MGYMITAIVAFSIGLYTGVFIVALLSANRDDRKDVIYERNSNDTDKEH